MSILAQLYQRIKFLPDCDPVSKLDIEPCWLEGAENDNECRLGDGGLDVRVGDTDADRIGGETGGVNRGVLVWDTNNRPGDTRGLGAAMVKQSNYKEWWSHIIARFAILHLAQHMWKSFVYWKWESCVSLFVSQFLNMRRKVKTSQSLKWETETEMYHLSHDPLHMNFLFLRIDSALKQFLIGATCQHHLKQIRQHSLKN